MFPKISKNESEESSSDSSSEEGKPLIWLPRDTSSARGNQNSSQSIRSKTFREGQVSKEQKLSSFKKSSSQVSLNAFDNVAVNKLTRGNPAPSKSWFNPNKDKNKESNIGK